MLRNTLLKKCKYHLPYPTSMWINASEFTGKDNNEIASCMYSFFSFFIQLWICTWSLHFPGEVFDIMYEDLLNGFYSLPFTFSGKVLLVIFILLLFSLILYTCLLGFFWVAQTKNHLKVRTYVGRKCCQLKVIKVSLMHLFVTLLINKTSGSDNRHFFFNTLGNENKEEFLTYSTFCTLKQIKKYILRKRLSQDVLFKVHLNKYGSYFMFILLLSGDINLNPEKEIIYYWSFSLFTTVVFLLSRWIISLILYL